MNKFNEQTEEEKMTTRTSNLLKYLSSMRNSKIANYYLNKLVTQQTLQDAFAKLNEEEEKAKEERDEKLLEVGEKPPELKEDIAHELMATQDTTRLDLLE